MKQERTDKSLKPFYFGTIIFILLLATTGFTTYERYLATKETAHAELQNELNSVYNKFRNILNDDITAANTMSIICKEYGTPANYDSVAKQIMEASKYVEAIQITHQGIITHVYPPTPYTQTIGINTLADSIRMREADEAVQKKTTYFVGPRKLRMGGIGILGKLPIIINDKIEGFVVVLTKIETIQKALALNLNGNERFAFVLTKRNSNDTTQYDLTTTKPYAKSDVVSLIIPEGNWLLSAAYTKQVPRTSLFLIAGVGLLVSLLLSLLIYRRTKLSQRLEALLKIKANELTSNEKYFRTLIETSSDAVVLMDNQGKVLYQTPSTERITGYTLKDFQHIDGIELIYPDDRAENNQFFVALISNPGTVLRKRHRLKHKNGHYIWIEGTYRNLLQDEHVKAIVFNYSDISEKLSYEDSLRKSETRFRGAFEHAAIGMALVSLSGQWLMVNKALCEMIGYTEEELLPLTFQHITHPDDLQKDIDHLQQTLAGTIDYYRMEKRYIHKDGTLIWVNLNVSIIRDNELRPQYFISQIENISRRKESEIALIQSEANLRSIFENSEILYLLLDVDYTIISFNQRMMHVYKDVAGQLIEPGKNILAMIPDEKREQVRDIYDDVITNNRPQTYETIYQLKDGPKCFMAYAMPITLNNNIAGICISSIEITKIKELEIERQKMIDDLLVRNRDLQQFSYIVSHNLRGPLSTILGLSILMEDETSAEERGEYMAGIRASSEKLDAVIKDLNQILQIRRELSEVKVIVDLNETLLNVTKSISLMVKENNASIEANFSKVNKLHTVSSYINSIFYNLISNSILFAKPGVPPLIQVWTELEGGNVIIHFKDNGMGINLDVYQDRIFGLYQRFHLSVEGKGLGLFMTKTQVEVLSGKITVDSTPGMGTTFTITLPQ